MFKVGANSREGQKIIIGIPGFGIELPPLSEISGGLATFNVAGRTGVGVGYTPPNGNSIGLDFGAGIIGGLSIYIGT